MTSLLVATALAMNSYFPQDNQPPTIALQLDDEQGISGGPVTGTITITFADGLHGYQNPPSQDYQIPVSVSSGTPGVKLVQTRYPAGEAHKVGGETEESFTYSGVVKIPVLLKVTGKLGETELAVKVRYQQCTNNMCFAPATLSISAKFRVNPTPDGWNSVASAAYWAKAVAERS